MQRVSFYIDGFNVYHVIDRFSPRSKWLNLRQMVESVIPKTSKVAEVVYFSALATWKQERTKKHLTYIEALRTTGVQIVLGQFKAKDRKCRFCHKSYMAHEEKETDVNLALRILEDAIDDKFDSAIIVSGDTDFEPIIATVKCRFPEKRIGVMLPIGSRAESLKQVAQFTIRMKHHHLTGNQFPAEIAGHGRTINIPEDWK